MKVYTVERCFDYEGCTLLAVYATREMADARAKSEERWEGDDAPTVTEWEVKGSTVHKSDGGPRE